MRPLLQRLGGGLARDAVLAVAARLVAVVLSFLFTLIVSRTLSIGDADTFFFVFAAITIAANVGKGGLTQVGMRTMARVLGRAGRATVTRRVLWLSVLHTMVAAAGLAVFLTLQRGEVTISSVGVALAAATAISLALTPVTAFLIRGLGDVVGGISLEMSLFYAATVLALLIVGGGWGWQGALGITATAGAVALAAAAGWLALRIRRDAPPDDPSEPVGEVPTIATLFRSSRVLLIFGSVNVLSTWFPQIALGLRAGNGETALYTVALRIALLVSLVLSAMNVAVAPRFARLSQEQDFGRLRRTYHRTVQLTLALTLPLVLAGVLFPGPILRLFGDAYVQAVPALLILMVGRLVNVATGSVGNLLIMSDREGVMTRIVLATGLGSVILTYVIAGRWGHVGVAVVTATFLALQNIIALIVANRIYGLYRLRSR